MKNRRTRAAALAAVFVLTSFPASAGLRDALDSMFAYNNVTGGGAYASQTRGGFVGGSIVGRSPIRQINLVSFDPIRINAGCGGLDLFGGSFSFINSEQLVALFRSIVQNAVGALFKIAIDAIQPYIGGVMNQFQSLMNALNLGSKNTCAIANQMVSAFKPSAQKTQQQEEKSMADSIGGAASDLWESITNFFSFKGENTKPAESASNPDGTSSEYGNKTWRAMFISDSAQQLGDPGLSVLGKRETMELIQSILGTEVVIEKTVDGKKKTEPLRYEPTVVNVQYLVEGLKEGDTQRLLGCESSNAHNSEHGCDTINENKLLTSADWPGTKGSVNKVLFGDVSGQTITAASIIDRVNNCTTGAGDNVCGFSAEQRAFVENTSVPIMYFLRKAQGSPAMAESIASLLAPVVAQEYTVRLMRAIVQTASKTWNGVKDVTMPELVAENLRDTRNQLAIASATLGDELHKIQIAETVISTMLKNNPNLVGFRR